MHASMRETGLPGKLNLTATRQHWQIMPQFSTRAPVANIDQQQPATEIDGIWLLAMHAADFFFVRYRRDILVRLWRLVLILRAV